MQVNEKIETNPNTRLLQGDVVLMDGKAVVWQESELEPHRYLKLHKTAGVVVSTDLNVPNNIMGMLELLSNDTITTTDN